MYVVGLLSRQPQASWQFPDVYHRSYLCSCLLCSEHHPNPLLFSFPFLRLLDDRVRTLAQSFKVKQLLSMLLHPGEAMMLCGMHVWARHLSLNGGQEEQVHECCQMQADWGLPLQGKHNIGDRDMEREIIPMCKDMGLGVAPWNVLGAGKFTGRFKKVRFRPLLLAASQRNLYSSVVVYGTALVHVCLTSGSGPFDNGIQRSEPLLVATLCVYAAGSFEGADLMGWHAQGEAEKEAGRSAKLIKMSENDYAIADVVHEIAEELGATPSQVVYNWSVRQAGITSPLIGKRLAD